MSYDLRIFSVRPFDPAMFENVKGWDTQNSSFRSANWQIVVNSSDKILPEDIEDEIASLLPGLSFLTELNLEGKRTGEAQRRLISTARKIAKATHGVIADPQEDTIETPSGVSRFSRPSKQETLSVIQLSWWFLNDALLDKTRRELFIELLERLLPEAMPKRYGSYEPPQHRYSESGKEHFQSFLEEHLEDITWYPHRPVASVSPRCPKPLGPSWQGFRSNLLEIEIESAVLNQPGWPENLQYFWRQMSVLLRPIYGDVRTVGGFTYHGGTTWGTLSHHERYDEITRSWFWRGIPIRLGQAVVLGEVYQRLWPEFVAKSEILDGLAFASMADWSSEEDLSTQIGTAPSELQLRPGKGIGDTQEYPEIWPFGPMFAPRRAKS